jgi:hypothetical protein
MCEGEGEHNSGRKGHRCQYWFVSICHLRGCSHAAWTCRVAERGGALAVPDPLPYRVDLSRLGPMQQFQPPEYGEVSGRSRVLEVLTNNNVRVRIAVKGMQLGLTGWQHR